MSCENTSKIIGVPAVNFEERISAVVVFCMQRMYPPPPPACSNLILNLVTLIECFLNVWFLQKYSMHVPFVYTCAVFFYLDCILLYPKGVQRMGKGTILPSVGRPEGSKVCGALICS